MIKKVGERGEIQGLGLTGRALASLRALKEDFFLPNIPSFPEDNELFLLGPVNSETLKALTNEEGKGIRPFAVIIGGN